MTKKYRLGITYQKLFRRYAKKYFPSEEKELMKKTNEIYNRFKKEAPDLGRRKNMMAGNLDMALAFFAFYEAVGRRIDGKAVEEMIGWNFEGTEFLGKLVDFNKPWLAKLMNKMYIRYAKKVENHKAKGEWLGSWGVLVNPEKHEEGCAFHLVGCPLVEFAKSHGYMHLMPYLCATDHVSAGVMNSKLIRTHTVAEGAAECDFWYVGDKSEAARIHK